ncbi:peptidase S8 [Halobiforma lacisalsi AJ5]|uniref:Peptidase S8 n=1 Tax=Natronobacterium lacisalsi AJ5 TaxID=358396 RepID=M0LCA1_NATLA|nr:S8 family serine peptidase [Halobiforma lacisalsi]APW99080.1 peptidase S8 [Halobiforma lacisalsi AJ5]EMA31197.1 peptidase S8 and S53 subtilisin kexin sedolisin [Halobiforma lacisalsi AJ5]
MNRRIFLARTGVSIGTLTLGSTAASAATEGDEARRFVVDRRGLGSEADLEVVHEMDPVDLLVVRATEERLEDAGAPFAPDVRLPAEPHAPVDREPAGDEVGTGDGFRYQWDKQDQRIPEAHEVTRGEGTRVAIIDSGIAAGHPDLEGQVNLALSRSFAEDGYGVGAPYGGTHGTHVAGIVAASDETDGGVIGSAPGAELVDLRVFGANLESRGGDVPPGYWADTYMGTVMAALVYAAEIGCDAANLSLGWTWRMRQEGWGRFWGKVHQRVGNYARGQGTLHTHASGNWGESLQFNRDETDSSQTAGGITTSATGPVGFDPETEEYDEPPYSPSTYTTHGVGAIDLAAPGGKGGESQYDDVYNAIALPQFDEDGEYLGAEYGYAFYAGTSMAAPQVAGAAALVKSAHSEYNANQVRIALTRTAERPDEYENKYYGSGYLDTCAAVTG